MTTGIERVRATLSGKPAAHVPICPILHTMSTRLLGCSIGEYATNPRLMADCVLAAYRAFGYDGVQLSLGVAAEAEALGSRTHQPEDGLPAVVAPLLQCPADLTALRLPNPERDGRLGMFAEAVAHVSAAVGREAWIIATLRGPLLMATQLRGIEHMLIDLIERPAWAQELFAFTTQVGIVCGRALLQAGAHAIAIGEATSSPEFISPAMYRQHVADHQRQLVEGLHAAGCETTIMHICGQTEPIIPDVAATGTDVMDIDWQVDPARALELAGPRMALRGNIDPVGALLDGTPELVEQRVNELLTRVAGRGRLLLSSGCDVPPNTPPENIRALVQAGRRFQDLARSTTNNTQP